MMLQRNGRTLEQALIDVEVSNARAIALGRRYVALQQEVEQTRLEIANAKSRREELAARPRESGHSAEDARRLIDRLGRWIPAVPTGKRKTLRAYLDAVGGIPFSNGMSVRRQGQATITLTGWAFLTINDASATSTNIKAISDSVEVITSTLQQPREDVATYFDRPELMLCGFHAELPISGLPNSPVRILLELVDTRGVVHKKVLGKLTLIS